MERSTLGKVYKAEQFVQKWQLWQMHIDFCVDLEGENMHECRHCANFIPMQIHLEKRETELSTISSFTHPCYVSASQQSCKEDNSVPC